MNRALAILIQLAVEELPRVVLDVLDEQEEFRVAGWLAQRPDYQALIEIALELSQEARAA